VHEFNDRFLELLSLSARSDAQRVLPEFVRAHRGALLALDRAARGRASRSPFLLVDIQLRNPQWWEWASHEESRQSRTARPPVLFAPKLALEVMYEALVLTWHTVRWSPQVAVKILGMSPMVCAIVAPLGLKHLRHLASHHYRELRPRWEHLTAFWATLLTAACRETPGSLRNLIRHGLQLLDQDAHHPDPQVRAIRSRPSGE
jgi:hypothetical protein